MKTGTGTEFGVVQLQAVMDGIYPTRGRYDLIFSRTFPRVRLPRSEAKRKFPTMFRAVTEAESANWYIRTGIASARCIVDLR